MKKQKGYTLAELMVTVAIIIILAGLALPNFVEFIADQRLKQAAQHLQKGRGFEAFVLLNDFPESAQSEQAAALLPLARFLFDMDDGDGLTGVEALDMAYESAAQAMKRRNPAQALEQLFTALDAGEEMDHAYTTDLIQAMFALLGENNPLVVKYQEQLAV